MTREPENELAQELRDELRGLVRGPELPPALEARVVRALEIAGSCAQAAAGERECCGSWLSQQPVS